MRTTEKTIELSSARDRALRSFAKFRGVFFKYLPTALGAFAAFLMAFASFGGNFYLLALAASGVIFASGYLEKKDSKNASDLLDENEYLIKENENYELLLENVLRVSCQNAGLWQSEIRLTV